MSSSNSIGPFSLNNVIVRKPIKFPDGSVQSTAFSGRRVEITDGARSTTLLSPLLLTFDTISGIEDDKVYSYSGYLTLVNDANAKTNVSLTIQQEADGTTNYLATTFIPSLPANQTINIPISTIQSSGSAGGGTSFSINCKWSGDANSIAFTYYRMETFKICDLV